MFLFCWGLFVFFFGYAYWYNRWSLLNIISALILFAFYLRICFTWLITCMLKLWWLIINIERAIITAYSLFIILSGVIFFCICADRTINFNLLWWFPAMVNLFLWARMVAYTCYRVHFFIIIWFLVYWLSRFFVLSRLNFIISFENIIFH